MAKKKYKVKKVAKTRKSKSVNKGGKKNAEVGEVIDVRWSEFLANYIDPQSETFGNAKQSAIRAKFSEGSANRIKSYMPEAVSEKIRQSQRLEKAEKHLDKVLEMNEVEPMISMFGPVEKKDKSGKKTGEFYTRINPNILKTKTDVAKFLAETIGKSVYSKQVNTVGLHFHKTVLDDEQLRKLERIRTKRSIGEDIG